MCRRPQGYRTRWDPSMGLFFSRSPYLSFARAMTVGVNRRFYRLVGVCLGPLLASLPEIIKDRDFPPKNYSRRDRFAPIWGVLVRALQAYSKALLEKPYLCPLAS